MEQWCESKRAKHALIYMLFTVQYAFAYLWPGLFDLNHTKNHWFMIFLFPIFLNADLYEFSTNNYLQASRSTKFCMLF